MDKIIILVILLVCLFGPMTLFTIVGKNAIEALGRRPSQGPAVMIPFLLKLVAAAAISIVLLMILLKVFGPDSDRAEMVRFINFEWRLLK